VPPILLHVGPCRHGHALYLGFATLWLAELGGYTGPKSSGGPPGSMMIKRELDFVLLAAAQQGLTGGGPAGLVNCHTRRNSTINKPQPTSVVNARARRARARPGLV
jgi:hypothetical protein